MTNKRFIVRLALVAVAASLLELGCGESGTAPPPTGGAGIPGLRGPAATPPKNAKGAPATKPAETAKPAEPKAG